MKARKFLFAVMTIATVMLFNACSEDPCEGETCSGNGTPTEVLETCTCDCDTGFSGDNCEDEDLCVTNNVNCGANGDCVDGTCECDAGYEGDSCQTVSRNKFIGDFTGVDDCTVADYPVEIASSSTGVDKIVLKGFGKWLCNGIAPDVIATVDESSLSIASQTFCTGSEFIINSGTGTISANQVTITIQYVTTNTASENCTVVLNRL